MRATTLLNRVLDLPGVHVTGVDLGEPGGTGEVVVDVALQRRLLACPACSFTTARRLDRRDVDSSWRHLDLGGRPCRLRMRRRRLACPEHGVVTQKVPFARPGARFTSDFEDLVVWLVTRSDKTTVATFARVVWRTVGAMCERVAADVLDPHRLEGLVDIGVDEISWRKHHRYLTLVSDHATSTIVWGAPGKDAASLGKFFDDLPEGGVEQVQAVSMDLGLAYIKAVRERAPHAVICFDPFHVIKLATDALDSVRRQVWQSARRYPDKAIAKKYKGARWALLKNPQDLTDTQGDTLKSVTPQRWCPVAGLPAQGSPTRRVRRRPAPGRRDGPDRAVVLPSPTQPDPRLRQGRRDDPKEQGRHHRRDPAAPVERPP